MSAEQQMIPIESAYVLRVGDKVLVMLHGRPDVAGCRDVRDRLVAEFPGVEFVLMVDVAGVLVWPAAGARDGGTE